MTKVNHSSATPTHPYRIRVIAKRWSRPLTFAEPSTGESPEGGPEVHRVQGVNKRVHGTIKPAQPSQQSTDPLIDGVLGQERRHQIGHKEGQPAKDEATHDYRQCLCRLVLPLQRHDAVGHGLLVHAEVCCLLCGESEGVGARGSIRTARRAIVPLLCIAIVFVAVRGNGPGLLWLLVRCCFAYRRSPIDQFVLSIPDVLVEVAVVVVVGGGDATRITSPATGQRDLSLYPTGGHCRGRTSRTGWFRIGHIIHIDFHLGHFYLL